MGNCILKLACSVNFFWGKMDNFAKTSPAILMCTCRAYTEIAQATCNLLELFWQDHPEIFVVGGKDITGGQSVPFSCHERDWVGMAYEAVRWLQSNSFTHCYLILDDHPPVGFCNSEFLNRTLPELCGQLNATHVALAGWDQFQPKDGVLITVGRQQWMLNSLSYKWKFDLHPGYWNLVDLEIILKKNMDISPRMYSAREFEGISGSGKLALPDKFLEATYKIS
ncbi:MAG: hypothetical protein D3910_06325, partial [Candidatus Electrothrix sp. ATG2]|nr:hypothetical protein [Candidatus Electrothrix sp. ATG2]